MVKKRLFAMFVIIAITVSLYSWPMGYNMFMAWQASPGAAASENPGGEPAIAVTPSYETAYGKTIAAVPYYPVIYNEEFYYRNSYNEPIRDFRSYKVKTFSPKTAYNIQQHNEPIRDFRYYSDADPNYKIVTSASNSGYNKRGPYRDFRDIPQNNEQDRADLTY